MPYKVMMYELEDELPAETMEDADQIADHHSRIHGKVTKIINITDNEYQFLVGDNLENDEDKEGE